MILYHVATNVFTTGQCTIYPRIPKSAAPDEDKKLPRICLSDSIEHCLEALLTKVRPSTRMLPSAYTRRRLQRGTLIF